jgi:uncharacterized protein YgbK (DUF1537 family)
MLYTFYGDDFTGSTDVLEALARAGVPAVLFLAPPTHEDLAQFPDVQAIGIAGDSRSRSPEWMSSNLPGIFRTLESFGAPIVHYKICSTFDSAPHIGSIGRALELGVDTLHPRFVPIVVGAPHLGRFVLFGNLYAAAGAKVHRIDRHPSMSRHPVTPMREADLCKHLALQTNLPIALLDLRDISSTALDNALATSPAAVVFDGFDAASLAATGDLLWQHAQQQALFAIGSSGLTESLIPTWKKENLILATRNSSLKNSPLKTEQDPCPNQLLIVSGSCSPITQTQIEWALANGFHGIPLDPDALINNPAALATALQQTLEAISAGQSPVLYTALGPLNASTPPHNEALGSALGSLVEQIIRRSTVRRTVLCGGDTSSHAIQRLPITALTSLSSLAPGAPLCRAYSPDPKFHNAEFLLKGGQVGPPDFFEKVRCANPL